MVHFECFQEIKKNFVFGLFAAFDIWMILRIVKLLNIAEFNNTILGCVEFVKDLLDKLSSEVIKCTSNIDQELVNAQLSVVIFVEKIKQLPAFFLAYLYTEVIHGLPELLNIKRARVVVVHDFKNALETYHATCTSFGKHSLYLLNELIITVLDSGVIDLVAIRVIVRSPCSRLSMSSCTPCYS